VVQIASCFIQSLAPANQYSLRRPKPTKNQRVVIGEVVRMIKEGEEAKGEKKESREQGT
jgi:hypothetical protein